jgi:sigma-E factor negative regulatory protein RseC
MSIENPAIGKLGNGFEWVCPHRQSAGGACARKTNCSSIYGGKQMLDRVRSDLNAPKGDSADFHLNLVFLLQCTFIIYIVPVLGLISGAVAAAPMTKLTGLSLPVSIVVLTAAGFLAAVWLSRLLIHRKIVNDLFLPIIKRVF